MTALGCFLTSLFLVAVIPNIGADLSLPICGCNEQCVEGANSCILESTCQHPSPAPLPDCIPASVLRCECDAQKGYIRDEATGQCVQLGQCPCENLGVCDLVFQDGDITYCLNKEPRNYIASLEFCAANNMELVAIETSSQNDAIRNNILSYLGTSVGRYWTSGTRQGDSTTWKWYSTGQPLTFTDWGSGEPNNWGGNEECVEMWFNSYSTGYWNDLACSSQVGVLCQTPGPNHCKYRNICT